MIKTPEALSLLTSGACFLAGETGFEPVLTVLETAVLPG